jgi:hypothetical protein
MARRPCCETSNPDRPRWAGLAGTIGLIVTLVACGGDSISQGSKTTGTHCGETPGAPDDLRAEPHWAPSGTRFYRWVDAAGCPVRLDVITDIHGPAHCDLETSEFITIGEPIGASSGRDALGPTTARTFMGSVKGSYAVDVATLPASAYDTGYRCGEDQLWLDHAHRDVAYRIRGTRAQILTPVTLFCA